MLKKWTCNYLLSVSCVVNWKLISSTLALWIIICFYYRGLSLIFPIFFYPFFYFAAYDCPWKQPVMQANASARKISGHPERIERWRGIIDSQSLSVLEFWISVLKTYLWYVCSRRPFYIIEGAKQHPCDQKHKLTQTNIFRKSRLRSTHFVGL